MNTNRANKCHDILNVAIVSVDKLERVHNSSEQGSERLNEVRARNVHTFDGH